MLTFATATITTTLYKQRKHKLEGKETFCWVWPLEICRIILSESVCVCVCDSVSKNIMDTFLILLILFLGKRATVCLKLISSTSFMYSLPLDSMTVDNTSSLATFVAISKTLNAHYAEEIRKKKWTIVEETDTTNLLNLERLVYMIIWCDTLCCLGDGL